MIVLIRKWQVTDTDEIVDLFYGTVHTVNRRDYSPEQLHAWADPEDQAERRAAWRVSFQDRYAYVAQEEGVITGFTDMTSEGYIDRLFVHHAYQGQGAASALLCKLEEDARRLGISMLRTEASLTARPFFERRGFSVVTKQQVTRKGISLTNMVMSKQIEGTS